MVLQVTAFILLALCVLEVPSQAGPWGYNFDQMAQSYCASQSKEFTFALRRDCSGVGPTCNNICKTATKPILDETSARRKRVICYDGIHIKLVTKLKPHQPDAGRVSMVTYGYGSQGCTWQANHCGPNYCCCKAVF